MVLFSAALFLAAACALALAAALFAALFAPDGFLPAALRADTLFLAEACALDLALARVAALLPLAVLVFLRRPRRPPLLAIVFLAITFVVPLNH